MPLLHALQKPNLEVVDPKGKPGRPIDNRPQVVNLPYIARGGSVSETFDGQPPVLAEACATFLAGCADELFFRPG